MKVRVITSAIIVAVALPIIIFSRFIIYPIALSLLSAFALYEVFRVVGIHRELAISVPAYAIGMVMPIVSYFVHGTDRFKYLLIVFVVLFVYLLYMMGTAVFSKGRLTLSTIGVAFLTATYVIASFTSLSTVRYLHADAQHDDQYLVGLFCLMLVFFISWGCDVFAYLVGSLIGKHKLIPEVSPKKSVEGAIGGIVGSVGVSLLLSFVATWITKATDLVDVQANYLVIGIMAAVFSVVAQIGDLIASFIKREYGVKDYSNLLPGHGGIMDRFDSILAVATPLLITCLFIQPYSYIG